MDKTLNIRCSVVSYDYTEYNPIHRRFQAHQITLEVLFFMDKRSGKRVRKDRFPTNFEHSLDALFDRFYTVKKAEGRANGTLNKYKMNYDFFLEFLSLKNISPDVRNVTTDLIRDYIVWMLH